MTDPAQLAALVERTAATVSRRRLVRASAWCLAALPVALLTAVALDALCAPNEWARAALTALWAGGPLVALLAVLAFSSRFAPDAEQARRLAERATGDEQRALTATLQLAAMPGVLAQAGAMRLAEAVDRSGLAGGLPRADTAHAAQAALAALIVGAVLHLVLPNLLPTVLPRLLDPFGDHPPYSSTRLLWVDPPASARPGESPRLRVATIGPEPRELWLAGTIPGLNEAVRVPLVQEAPNRWAVALAPLPAPPVAEGAVAVLWAEGSGTRTPRLRLRLDPVPVLRECALRLVAPAYARLDDALATATAAAPARFAALPGSRITVKLTANRALAGVWLTRDGGAVERWPLNQGRLELADPVPGRYALALEAEDGVRGDAATLLELTRRVDQPPEVRISQPPNDGIATPGAKVPLVIEASDDLGLASLTWQLLVDDVLREEHIETLGGTGDAYRGSVRMLNVKPGQVVKLVAVARDTLPPAGQLSTPAVRSLTIIADREYNDLVRDQLSEQALLKKYEPLLQRLAELEREAAKLAAEPTAPAAERQRRLAELADKAQQLAQDVKTLERPDPLFDAEPDLQKALEQRIADLERAARDGKPGERGADRADEMAKDLKELTDRAVADALAKPLDELATAQERIAKELADLKRRSGANPSDADRARLRALAERQQELNQALQDWQQLAEETAKDLAQRRPKDAQDLAGQCRALRDQGVGKLGETAAREARSGHAQSAEPPAGEAAQILRAIAGASPEAGSCRNGWCASDKLGSCRGQLARLAKLGMGRGGSPNSSGGGAAMGAFGGGMMVRPGGRPSGASLPLYGPEPLASLAGGRPGGNNSQAPGAAAVRDAEGVLHPATPYAAGTRATAAGIGAPLGPGEQRLIDDYFRRLDGDALAPQPPSPQEPRP